MLDTPGFIMFVHEAEDGHAGRGSWLVVVDGVSGVEVVTEKIWQYAEEIEMPRVIMCSRMDRERADYKRVWKPGQCFRPHGDSRPTADRQREELQRRHRPGDDEGLHLRNGWKRQRQGRRRFRQNLAGGREGRPRETGGGR